VFCTQNLKLILRLRHFSERQQIKTYFLWLDLMLSASSTLTVIKSLDFQDPTTSSREPLGRPHLLRMDSSLEPWQIASSPGSFYCPILKWSCASSVFKESGRCCFSNQGLLKREPWNPVSPNLPITKTRCRSMPTRLLTSRSTFWK